MGVTTAWGISAHTDAYISLLAPRILPRIEEGRRDPQLQQRWRRWQQAPLADYGAEEDTLLWDDSDAAWEAFWAMAYPGEFMQPVWRDCDGDEHFHLEEHVWEQYEGPEWPYLGVATKDSALAALFHALGPRRAALLPGWLGNALLTSSQIRAAWPQVERAFSFPDATGRKAAEDRDWFEPDDEESVLDGPLRVWRHAAEQGLGLCAVNVTIY